MPSALSQIQFVDYQQQDRSSAFRLARAFVTLPAPKPLPNPLPIPPQAPISYLGTLTERIETTDILSYENQSSLLLDLKRSLRESENTSDALTLLKRLRKRRDLFAVIAEEIDEILNISIATSPAEPSLQEIPNHKEVSVKNPPSTRKDLPRANITKPPNIEPLQIAKRTTITRRERIKGSCFGAFLGIVVGMLLASTVPYMTPISVMICGLIVGAGGAISGSISGTQRQLIIAALSGAIVGWLLILLLWTTRGRFAAGEVYGASLGAILGAIIGVILRNRQK